MIIIDDNDQQRIVVVPTRGSSSNEVQRKLINSILVAKLQQLLSYQDYIYEEHHFALLYYTFGIELSEA